MHLSIVVPAYNEADRIGTMLAQIADRVAASTIPVEVLVVDDGSTDATAEVVDGFLDAIPGLQLLTLPVNRGKGRAVAQGMLAATGTVRVFLDADASTAASEIDTLLAVVAANPRAVAIGSLRVPGTVVRRHQPPVRKVAGRVGNAVVRALVLPGIADSQRGCKMFPGELADVVFADLVTDGWAFDIEVLARCRAAGYRVCEVPVRWDHVPGGRIGPMDYVRTLRDVLQVRRILRSEGIHARVARHPRSALGLRPLDRA